MTPKEEQFAQAVAALGNLSRAYREVVGVKPDTTPQSVWHAASTLAARPHVARRIDEIRAADLLGEYPALRYYPPTGDLYFDVLTRLGEAASFETVDAETKEVEGIRVRVATPLALYRLKRGTARALDHQDAAALRDRFDLDEE